MLERILANHSKYAEVKPGDILDIMIDARIARDFGGANVVKNINDFGLQIEDPQRTFFTFDCNPTGSDQKYAVNQHICRTFARKNGIRVFDIDAGIGTHVIIDEGIVVPGQPQSQPIPMQIFSGQSGHSAREWEIWILHRPGTRGSCGSKCLKRSGSI